MSFHFSLVRWILFSLSNFSVFILAGNIISCSLWSSICLRAFPVFIRVEQCALSLCAAFRRARRAWFGVFWARVVFCVAHWIMDSERNCFWILIFQFVCCALSASPTEVSHCSLIKIRKLLEFVEVHLMWSLCRFSCSSFTLSALNCSFLCPHIFSMTLSHYLLFALFPSEARSGCCSPPSFRARHYWPGASEKCFCIVDLVTVIVFKYWLWISSPSQRSRQPSA